MLRNLYALAVLLLSIACFGSQASAQTVTFDTNLGNIVIELFPDEAPISVENFLGYVTRGDYDGTIIHRSVTNFVVQGGSFLTDGTAIPTLPPIQNEFGRSNLRGTIAFARQSSIVDSATSSFFFNLEDSNSFLDTIDEGFTVFGEVVLGLDLLDAINDLQIVNAGGALGELPVLDTFSDATVDFEDLVVINAVTVAPVAVPEPSSFALITGCSMLLVARRRRS